MVLGIGSVILFHVPSLSPSICLQTAGPNCHPSLNFTWPPLKSLFYNQCDFIFTDKTIHITNSEHFCLLVNYFKTRIPVSVKLINYLIISFFRKGQTLLMPMFHAVMYIWLFFIKNMRSLTIFFIFFLLSFVLYWLQLLSWDLKESQLDQYKLAAAQNFYHQQCHWSLSAVKSFGGCCFSLLLLFLWVSQSMHRYLTTVEKQKPSVSQCYVL